MPTMPAPPQLLRRQEDVDLGAAQCADPFVNKSSRIAEWLSGLFLWETEAPYLDPPPPGIRG
jgi:hypothetical protein